jgi:hypothetical protein
MMGVIKADEGKFLCCDECYLCMEKLVWFSMHTDFKPYDYALCISCLKDAINSLEEA